MRAVTCAPCGDTIIRQIAIFNADRTVRLAAYPNLTVAVDAARAGDSNSPRINLHARTLIIENVARFQPSPPRIAHNYA